jgi:hypothetical protein
MAKKSPSKRGTNVSATAFHAKSSDGTDVVGIGNLGVVIVQEGDHWFAQGLEIDYAAEGSSLKDVQSRFEDGLEATLHEHLRIYGDIERILKIAPPEVWKHMLLGCAASGKRDFHSQVSSHKAIQQFLPFEAITYLHRWATRRD